MSMTVKDLKEIIERKIEELGQMFSDFRKNDFFHLEEKVDRLTRMLYIGIGMLIVTNIIIGIVARILF